MVEVPVGGGGVAEGVFGAGEPDQQGGAGAGWVVEVEVGGRVDLTSFLATAGRLTGPVNDFFDQVLVMADDPALRAARLGLLATIRDLGSSQLDWTRLRG